MSINERGLRIARDVIASRREEAASIREQKREHDMTHLKTSLGDKVVKPPSTTAVRQQIDELFQEAAAALDVATEAARRDAEIQRTNVVDERRFPAVGGDH